MKDYETERLIVAAVIIWLAIIAVVFTIVWGIDELCEMNEEPVLISYPGVRTSPQDTSVVPISDQLDIPDFLIEPEPISEPLEAPVSVAAPLVEYYDVPLDEGLQDHIFALCDASGIDPVIIFAMIRVESMFKPDVIGDGGNAFGLMQIQPRWHQERMDDLGVTDLLDPYQNISVGFDFLLELYEHYDSIDIALAVYNGGPRAADDKNNRYVAKVRDNLERLEVRE